MVTLKRNSYPATVKTQNAPPLTLGRKTRCSHIPISIFQLLTETDSFEQRACSVYLTISWKSFISILPLTFCIISLLQLFLWHNTLPFNITFPFPFWVSFITYNIFNSTTQTQKLDLAQTLESQFQFQQTNAPKRMLLSSNLLSMIFIFSSQTCKNHCINFVAIDEIEYLESPSYLW